MEARNDAMSTTIKTQQDLMREMRQKFVTGDFSAGGGLLDTEQATRFIDTTVNLGVLMPKVTRKVVDNRSGEWYEIASGGYATQAAGAESTEHTTETFTIATKMRSWLAKKTHSAFAMTWEDLNWTVEGTSFESTVMNLWAKQLAIDWETLGLHGDAAKYDPANTAYKQLVNIDDGWTTLITDSTETHKVSVLSGGNPTTIDWTVFAKALNAMPEQFKANPNLAWICSPRLISDFRHYLVNREDIGGRALEGALISPEGIPFFNGDRGVPYIPWNLGTGTNESVILLCDPAELVAVFHREFSVYREFEPKRDRWWFNGFGYIDFVLRNPDAIVMVTGLAKDTTYGS